MVHWTQEATAQLQEYLDQVATYAHQQGQNPEEAVEAIRSGIARKIEERSIDFVDADVLYQLLESQGAPQTNAHPIASSNTQASAKNAAGCGVIGIIVAVVMILVLFVGGILAAILLPALSRAREAARRASCGNNLKQIGLVCKMYANESVGEMFPPLSEESGRLMFDMVQVYPEYLNDGEMFICPSSDYDSSGVSTENLIDDHSYYYISHVIANEEEGLAYVEAYRVAAGAGQGFDYDFVTADGSILPRISEHISADPNAPNQSQIPVMIERSDIHIPGGGNVLFMDGHVEFMKMDSGFPMTTEFLEALDSIDE